MCTTDPSCVLYCLKGIKDTIIFHPGQSPDLVSHTEMQVLVKAVRQGQRVKGSLVDCTGASVGDKCPSSCSLPVKFQVLSLNILGFPNVNSKEGKLDM